MNYNDYYERAAQRGPGLCRTIASRVAWAFFKRERSLVA